MKRPRVKGAKLATDPQKRGRETRLIREQKEHALESEWDQQRGMG